LAEESRFLLFPEQLPILPPMTYDILGLGAVALDEFLYVEEYPAADSKVRVQHAEVQCGGLTGNALVAAARLGAACAYAGRLGTSPEARLIAEAFIRENVDVQHATREPADGVVKSTIIVGTRTHTRNVFSRRTGLTGAHESRPSADLLRAARVLVLDHHAGAGGVRAARIARDAGIPVVADFERTDAPELAQLLELTSHLIVPESFARAWTGQPSAAEAAAALSASGRPATIVTCGAAGGWYSEGASEPLPYQPFEVAAVDTACCGDVFHGAYAAALVRGMALKKRLRFAAAAAAIKATRPGGQRGFPTAADVTAFLGA
jgi:sulfofructose kinase